MSVIPENIKPAFDFTERNPKTGGFVRVTDETKIRQIMSDLSPINHVNGKVALSSELALYADLNQDGLVNQIDADLLAEFFNVSADGAIVRIVGI